jgi:N-methylhydantoinase A/oxoprolinase/acetone carboxylase beta subunit
MDAVLRIVVDVGGTNTDAVLTSGRDVLASYKAPTRADAASGIVTAIDDVLKRAAVRPARLASR